MLDVLGLGYLRSPWSAEDIKAANAMYALGCKKSLPFGTIVRLVEHHDGSLWRVVSGLGETMMHLSHLYYPGQNIKWDFVESCSEVKNCIVVLLLHDEAPSFEAWLNF